MNRVQLIEKIAAEHNISKAQASRILATVTDTITERVKNDDPVTTNMCVDDTTFLPWAVKPQRTGRNPATGATITIAEKYVPKFVPGAAFKAAVER